ncbi:MAG: serine hydrolase [Marinicellaceae bacterium]
MKNKLTLLLFLISLSTSTLSMIIRHDVDPNLYLTKESKYPAVFPVRINGKSKECVATLIDSKWAITAAHCTVLINLSSKKPQKVLINNKNYTVKSIHIHPEFGEVRGVHDEKGQLIDMILNPENMSYDVALIELSQPVNDVQPIDLYTMKDEVNQEIMMLGWGDFSNGKTGTIREEPVNDGQFRKAYNVIDGIEDNYLSFNFDSPKSDKVHELEGVNGPGDSGGPALITKDKKLFIAGVSSRGYYLNQDDNYKPEGQYGWIENYVRVSTITKWMFNVMTKDSIGVNHDNLLKHYVGEYVYEDTGDTIKIYTKELDTKLYFFLSGEGEIELIATGDHLFSFKDEEEFKIEFKNPENSLFNELFLIQPHGTVKMIRKEKAKLKIDDLNTIDQKLIEVGFSGVVLVAQNDKILFNKAYGRKNNQDNGGNDINTVFDICSITKQFTAAGILKLSMQNKIHLDDKLSKYFDEVPKDKRNITIHNLLTHSSGLTAGIGHDYDAITEKKFLKKAFKSKLISPIGESFNYSNMGYSLLGLIIEKVSGMDYESFLNVEIFKPSKMNHTGYVIPVWEKNEVANGFFDGAEAKKPNEEHWSKNGPYLNLKANGGLLTRANDLLLWSQAIQNNSVLDEATTSQFLSPHFEYNGGNSNYGYGWWIENNNSETKLVHHSGGSELFASNLLIYPKKGITIIVLSNTPDTYVISVSRKISNYLLEKLTDSITQLVK